MDKGASVKFLEGGSFGMGEGAIKTPAVMRLIFWRVFTF